jgi:hypothetical protein
MNSTTLNVATNDCEAWFLQLDQEGNLSLLGYPVVLVNSLADGVTHLYFRPRLEQMEVSTRIQ